VTLRIGGLAAFKTRAARCLSAFGLSAAAIALALCAGAPAQAQSSEAIDFANATSCPLLNAYLVKYPTGRYAADARALMRLRACRDAPPPSAPTPVTPAPVAKAPGPVPVAPSPAPPSMSLPSALPPPAPQTPAPQTPAPQTPAPQTPAPLTQAGPAFSVDLLNPQVRTSVVAARDAENRALAAAQQAREAARQAALAAARARNGAPGGRVDREANGSVYEGDWVNNTATGHGVRVSGPNTSFAGDSYSGLWKADTKDALGVYTYANNRSNIAGSLSYEGAYANDAPNGYGVFSWRTGDRYAGGQKDGKRAGYGVYRFADGARFEGQYEEDRRVGAGVLWDKEGRVVSAGIWDGDKLAAPLSR
jgi:hypothetical protein